MTDEPVFSRPVNSDPVKFSTRTVPERRVLTGSAVQLEPLDPVRHGDALYRAGHDGVAALRSWEYLPWGPFPSEDALREQLRNFAAAPDLVYFAICDRATGEAFGKATYLDIYPQAGAIEIGGIWFAPAYQRTRAATEAMFLMLDSRGRPLHRRVHGPREYSSTSGTDGSRGISPPRIKEGRGKHTAFPGL